MLAISEIWPALAGWLWVAVVIGIFGAVAWISRQIDLGNSARKAFPGHVVHHSVGDDRVAVGINQSERHILVAVDGAIEVFPFSSLRFARPQRDGRTLVIEKFWGMFREAYPAVRMMAELVFEGRQDKVVVQLFDLDLPRSAFGRYAARQRGMEWLGILNRAARDDQRPAWGSSSVETSPRATGS